MKSSSSIHRECICRGGWGDLNSSTVTWVGELFELFSAEKSSSSGCRERITWPWGKYRRFDQKDGFESTAMQLLRLTLPEFEGLLGLSIKHDWAVKTRKCVERNNWEWRAGIVEPTARETFANLLLLCNQPEHWNLFLAFLRQQKGLKSNKLCLIEGDWSCSTRYLNAHRTPIRACNRVVTSSRPFRVLPSECSPIQNQHSIDLY